MMISKVYKEAIQKAADELNIPYYVAAFAYNSCWEFIDDKIKNLHEDLENITEEEFNKLKTNFVITGLGKLYTDYKKISGLMAQKNYPRVYKKERALKTKEYLETKKNKETIKDE